MQRTFNYTNRRRIKKTDVNVKLETPTDRPPRFDADLNISGMDLPENAAIYLEAYRGNTLQRFDFGTVGQLQQPANTDLTDIDLTGPTLFRVKVIDESEKVGRLVASATELAPEISEDEEEQDKESLLTVRTRDLAEIPWRLNFDNPERIELCLNKSIPNAIQKLREDPVFQSLVLPAAVRQIFWYLLWNENDLDDDAVAASWFRFAELLGEPRPDTADPADETFYVEQVVNAFTERFDFTTRLRNHLLGDE